MEPKENQITKPEGQIDSNNLNATVPNIKQTKSSNSDKEKKRKDIFKRIKLIAMNSMSTSTIHGYPKVFLSKRLASKIMWGFFSSLSIICCVWYVMNIVAAFYEYEVVTKFKLIDEVETNFPSVFFCVEKDQIHTFSCQFNSTEAFSYLVEKTYANNKCLLFNGAHAKNNMSQITEPLKLKEAGNNFGLKIRMYLKNPGSVKIFIGDNMVLPSVNEIGGINLRNGFETNLFLNKVSVKNLPYPHNDCRENLNKLMAFESELYRATVHNNYKYRQVNCFDICACKEISAICNCTCPGIFETSSQTNCYDNNCFTSKLNYYDHENNCFDSCPKECDSVFYSRTSSSYLYLQSITDDDKKKFAEYAKKNGIATNILNRVEVKGVAINIYLNDMRYTEISEVAKTTVTNLISDIGGFLGLFIGMSLLSLVEILDFFVEIIYLINEL